MIANVYDCKFCRLAAGDVDEEARVAGREDANIGLGTGSYTMTADLSRAVIFIHSHVVKAKRIGHPHKFAARIGDNVSVILQMG